MVTSCKIEYIIIIHGILLWASVGFLVPMGILVIRMSSGGAKSGRKKAFFYAHVFLQVISVILATISAIISIIYFENTFENAHQKTGLALHCLVWIQAIIGCSRPHSGPKRRIWYFGHWIMGVVISVMGMISIYTGLHAYHKKVSRNTKIWAILYTAQVSLMVLAYIVQDKWAKRGSVPASVHSVPMDQAQDNGRTRNPSLVQPDSKPNALSILLQ